MSSQNPPTLLGWLSEGDGNGLDGYEIRNGVDILIGRESKSCQLILNDLRISNRHLRIYSLTYEANVDPIQGFVYAEDLSTNGSYWQYKRGSRLCEALIGKGNAVLLSDGEQIRLSEKTCFIFRSALPARPVEHLDDPCAIQEMERKLFMNLYTVTDRELGVGAFGKVLMAIDCFRPRQMACKIVSLKRKTLMWSQRKDFANRLWQEVDLLKDLSHPNVIHVERVFYTENTIYIIEDLITGGDLMSYIDRKGNSTITAEEACVIVYQILQALQYLHGLSIVHRDLKPENVLMSTTGANSRVIVSDFGQATIYSVSRTGLSRRMKTLCGTLDFVAPEVHGKNPLVAKGKGYTIAADMWSLGALTTALYLGRSFFLEDSAFSDDAILINAAKCDLAELDHSQFWQSIDHKSRDFIKKLLTLDEESRLTAGQALAHEWFIDRGRRQGLEEKYQRIVKGWMPRRALLDFKEDLSALRSVRSSKTDSQLMPPPPKPNPKLTRPQPLQQAATSGGASPYFAAPSEGFFARATLIETENSLPLHDDGNKENPPVPKETIYPTGHQRIARPPLGSNRKLSTPSVQLLFERSVQSLSSAGMVVIRSDQERVQTEECRERSPSDDEEEKRIRAEASMEKRCFRSAKSLEQSIIKRRKLKG